MCVAAKIILGEVAANDTTAKKYCFVEVSAAKADVLQIASNKLRSETACPIKIGPLERAADKNRCDQICSFEAVIFELAVQHDSVLETSFERFDFRELLIFPNDRRHILANV